MLFSVITVILVINLSKLCDFCGTGFIHTNGAGKQLLPPPSLLFLNIHYLKALHCLKFQWNLWASLQYTYVDSSNIVISFSIKKLYFLNINSERTFCKLIICIKLWINSIKIALKFIKIWIDNFSFTSGSLSYQFHQTVCRSLRPKLSKVKWNIH